MSTDSFIVFLYAGFVAVFALFGWQVFRGKSEIRDASGRPRAYTRREKLLFVGFMLFGACGFFFDPFPKVR
jgi:hypothetical protein